MFSIHTIIELKINNKKSFRKSPLDFKISDSSTAVNNA